MSTGWRWVDDRGIEYKSKMAAAHELQARPAATFEFSELDMAGEHLRDDTEEIRSFLRFLTPRTTEEGDQGR